MSRVAGVDGCLGGWAAVIAEPGGGEADVRLLDSFRAVLDLLGEGVRAIAVDIPIGLLDEAVPVGRQCDAEARALLHSPRARSVFTPPVRPALSAASYEEAHALNRASSRHLLGLSRQSYDLLPKIREVDALMTPQIQSDVREAHPELIFWEMNGGDPMTRSKLSRKGMEERLEVLDRMGFESVRELVKHHSDRRMGPDDIADAFACCWTARRITEGTAVRVPRNRAHDSHGLSMEIWR